MAAPSIDALHQQILDIEKRQDRQEKDFKDAVSDLSKKLDGIHTMLLVSCGTVALAAIGVIITLLSKHS